MFKSPDPRYRNPKKTALPKPANPNNKAYSKKAQTTSDNTTRCCFINKDTNLQCRNLLGLYPQFCWLHTLKINNLVIKKSQISGAGNGLFSGDYAFKKGDVIAQYGSSKNLVSENKLLKRCGKDTKKCMEYVFCDDEGLSKKHIQKYGENCWDGRDIRSTIARFSNSAHGSRFKYNSEFDLIKGNPYLVATRNIPPHSEIFTNYGDTYEF